MGPLTWMGMAVLVGCDVGDASRGLTSWVVGNTIETTKGVADGVKTGVQEGRKGTTSTDGSQVLSTSEEVAAHTRLSVVEVQSAGEGLVDVVVAVENVTSTPLRLIGLKDEGGALLVDDNGFATPLADGSSGDHKPILVPPEAKVRTVVRFEGEAETAAAVRVWGQELHVP
jgi:hypothetical protein